MTIEQITQQAVALGIKLTNAETDTEICHCWADRVELAAMYFAEGKMQSCQKAIDDANRYAV